jgi:hypothetical protein
MAQRSRNNLRYVTNRCLDNNLFNEKWKTSVLPIEILFASQDFCKRYTDFFIYLLNDIPRDIINTIMEFIYLDKLSIVYVDININEHQTIQIGYFGMNRLFFDINHCENCKISIQCGECDHRIVGSLYCKLHMNCKCGFNRRFKECDICSVNSSKYIQYNKENYNKIIPQTLESEYENYKYLDPDKEESEL